MTDSVLQQTVAVVATEDTARVWAQALTAHRLPAVALAWGATGPPLDAAAPLRALQADDYDLVLVTSAAAARHLPATAGRGRPAAAVGEATAEAARAAGFRVVETGTGTSADLARRLAAIPPARRVLWLRGESAREEGAAILVAAGWRLSSVVSYRTRPNPGFGDLVRALGIPRAWVVGSPAAAAALLLALGEEAFPPGPGGPPVVVPGETTAAAVRIEGRVPPVVAASPTIEAIEAALRAVLGA